MYLVALNQFLDPVVAWVDDFPHPTTPQDDGRNLLILNTYDEAQDVANQVLQLLDEGREAALIFEPSLVM